MKATRNVRTIIKMVQDIQYFVTMAHAYHQNDRDPDGFELAQRALRSAEEICIKITSMYDPV